MLQFSLLRYSVRSLISNWRRILRSVSFSLPSDEQAYLSLSLRPNAHKMSISPTCLLPVERNDEELRNGRVCTSLPSCEIMSSIFWPAAKEWAGYSRLRCNCRLYRWPGWGGVDKQTKWRRIKEQKRPRPTQQFAALHLVAIINSFFFFVFFFFFLFFSFYTWTDVRKRPHVEFWIPADGYNTATAQNWPHPDVFPSFSCLHSNLSSLSSLFILVSYSFQHPLSLSYFFLRSFTLLTLHFFHFFLPHPPNRRPTNDPHPPTHQCCLFLVPNL